MKKIHLNESQLLEISLNTHFCAGTDTPYFVDEKDGEVYEAAWNSDYGIAFGYWPIDYSGTMRFAVGEPWRTHGDVCGQCAQDYVTDCLSERIGDQTTQIYDSLSEFVSNFNEYGYTYNEENDNYVSEDGSDIKDEYDFAEDVNDNVYDEAVDSRDYVFELVEEFLNNGEVPSRDDIERKLYDMIGDYDFTNKNGTEEALESIGMDFYDYFEMGHGEGRIWPQKQMIGFYESEQPDPRDLEDILYDLQDAIGIDVEEMLQYHMVFEDWRNDGTITACTLQDYIDGNYGPESYEDEENDEPIQYNNGQKTVFIPHLANQQDKREFFKGFRDTRDQAVYAPRERGAKTLAQYHAMRYPYGENKRNNNKVIK